MMHAIHSHLQILSGNWVTDLWNPSSSLSDNIYRILGLCIVCAVVIYKIIPILYRGIQKVSNLRTANTALTVNPTTVRPGQELKASVNLIPKTSLHIRRAVVQLVGVETYIQQTRSHHRGNTHYTYTRKTFERVASEHVIGEEHELLKGHKIDTAVNLTVPMHSIPTVQGKAVYAGGWSREKKLGISWKVKLECDIPNKIDLLQEKEITIVEPPGERVLSPRPRVARSTHRICTLTLDIENTAVCSYQKLQGVFKAEMLQDASVSRVIVTLDRQEKFGDSQVTIDIKESVVAQKGKLYAGQVYEWPFSFDIGEITVPSLSARFSSVTYTVKGKLDMKMKRDPSASQDVQVFV